MTDQHYIFLAGASRGVGREVARLLVEQGLKVKALLRSPTTQPELEAMGITVVMGDALNPAETETALLAAPIQAVISTIGGLPQDGQRSDYWGNKNLIDAAVKAGVQKFILVTSLGAGATRDAIPPQAYDTLKAVLAEKEKAEQHLIESDLTYTIIRPGGLKSEPATGHGVLTTDPTIAGMIHRADVAALVVQCLLSDKANNQVFSAVDRQMTYASEEFETVNLED